MNNPSFIVLHLCDNDFGWELEEAAKTILWMLGSEPIPVDERRLTQSIIDLLVGLHAVRNAANNSADNSFQVRSYLVSALRVEFADHAPQLDHDGGSVAIDRNRNYVWRF